nr:hypothetical protein [Oscillatoria sp. PCC 10802]
MIDALVKDIPQAEKGFRFFSQSFSGISGGVGLGGAGVWRELVSLGRKKYGRLAVSCPV